MREEQLLAHVTVASFDRFILTWHSHAFSRHSQNELSQFWQLLSIRNERSQRGLDVKIAVNVISQDVKRVKISKTSTYLIRVYAHMVKYAGTRIGWCGFNHRDLTPDAVEDGLFCAHFQGGHHVAWARTCPTSLAYIKMTPPYEFYT